MQNHHQFTLDDTGHAEPPPVHTWRHRTPQHDITPATEREIMIPPPTDKSRVTTQNTTTWHHCSRNWRDLKWYHHQFPIDTSRVTTHDTTTWHHTYNREGNIKWFQPVDVVLLMEYLLCTENSRNLENAQPWKNPRGAPCKNWSTPRPLSKG